MFDGEQESCLKDLAREWSDNNCSNLFASNISDQQENCCLLPKAYSLSQANEAQLRLALQTTSQKIGVGDSLLKVDQSLRRSGLTNLQLECYVSDLLSELFDQELLAIISAKPDRFRPDRNWLFLLDQARFELALDLSGLCKMKNEAAFFMQLAAFTSTNLAAFKENELSLIESFSNISPLLEQELIVLKASEPRKATGLIYFCSPYQEQLLVEYDVSNYSSLFMGKTTCDLQLLFNYNGELQSGKSICLSPIDRGLRLNSLLTVGSASFQGEWSQNSQSIFIKIKESRMDENNDKFNCHLSLGEIGISIEDLVNLRPGATIALKKPEQLQGVLRVGSSEWARVAISLQEEEIRLTVEEIASLTELRRATV